ncbi:hypothetical protein [Streptomyces barkulensis]|uniref:hypothetical protein n=1 Tax=Streptomyces barkulensis TaxID=1257026 RepID=UPI000C6DC421|nr:hypothetical protein [Streptomyces barkulensis]
MAGREPDRSDFLDAAREMADTGRPELARWLAEEAADRTTDPDEVAYILARYPDPTAHRKE